MKPYKNLSGYLLVLAAITFFTSWFLMPDPGTTDTVHILTIVKQARIQVLCSLIIQIISSVLYVIAAFLLLRNINLKQKAFTGIVLLAIGAMGLCADAFFHLLAWFMTDSAVNIQQDVVTVMKYMQTSGLMFLVPLLLPFFIGSILLTAGLGRQSIITKIPYRLSVISLLAGIAGAFVSKIMDIDAGPLLSLTVLGLFSLAQAWAGLQLFFSTGNIHHIANLSVSNASNRVY